MDLMEQQQAREQSQLLVRFKQLRDWQLQQQGLLMAQQQQQLEKLQEEQQRMQLMIAKQRQAQWGASNANKNGMSDNFRILFCPFIVSNKIYY